MIYLFRTKDRKKIYKVDANNIEQAKRFFLNDYVIINRKKK